MQRFEKSWLAFEDDFEEYASQRSWPEEFKRRVLDRFVQIKPCFMTRDDIYSEEFLEDLFVELAYGEGSKDVGFRRTEESDRYCGDMLQIRAIKLTAEHNWKGVIGVATRLLLIYPQNPVFRYNRGMAYAKIGDIQSAMEDMKIAKESEECPGLIRNYINDFEQKYRSG